VSSNDSFIPEESDDRKAWDCTIGTQAKLSLRCEASSGAGFSVSSDDVVELVPALFSSPDFDL
jgi:hypothetical protein